MRMEQELRPQGPPAPGTAGPDTEESTREKNLSPAPETKGPDTEDPASEDMPPEAPEDSAAVTPPPVSVARTEPARDELPRAMLAAYGDRLGTFEFGDEILPGFTAVEAVGHTPGHTAFSLKSGGQEILFVGDIVHAAALQFPEPDECAAYDRDKEQAVASRKRLLTLAAENNLPVAGAHIPFPGVGFVKTDGKRGFTFSPVSGLNVQ